jgi:hypothetical protein
MKGKVTLLVGGAIGYVLGTRAGRERYEQIKSQAQSLWQNPKVQEKASQAQDLAKEKGSEAASSAVSAVKDKVGGGDDSGQSSMGSTGSAGSAGTAAYPTAASTGHS